MVRINKCIVITAVALLSLTGCVNKTTATNGVASPSSMDSTAFSDENLNKAATDIKSKIQMLYDTGANMKLVMSDDGSGDWYLMYNKDKQCYAELAGGGAVVYQPEGAVTLFSSTVIESNDLDPLAIMTNMLKLAEQGKAELTTDILEETSAKADINNEAGQISTEETEEIQKESAESVEESLGGDTEVLNEYTITVKGLDNIKKIYALTLDDKATDEVINEALSDSLANPESLKENYTYTLKVNTKGDTGISAMLALNIDNIDYTVWWFDGYVALGNWELPKSWVGSHTSDEWVALYDELKVSIQSTIDNYAKTNFTSEQLKAMSESTVIEETSADLSETFESVEGGEPVGVEASINRESSFNDTVQALLKEDNLTEDVLKELVAPEGYTAEDKVKMEGLYGVIKEWDKNQVTGVVVSPISMNDIEFIKGYVEACKVGYSTDIKSSEVDKYGAIFWEDTLGTFIKMVQ